ncbi:MAG: hypothetical protein K6A77_10680, partial [Clostridiales bacterium]|nr:hypothetical protein [Clostridiales bacterium]
MSDNRRKRKKKNKGQPGIKEIALLIVAAAFLLCAIILITRGIRKDKAEKEARRRNASSESSYEEESLPEQKLTVSVEGETIPCLHQDDGLYVGFDECNAKVLHDGLILDEKNQQFFYTTLTEGKQKFPKADVPLMTKFGIDFIQLDWVAQNFYVTVEQEDAMTFQITPLAPVDESSVLKA